jgi:hypothetical protein
VFWEGCDRACEKKTYSLLGELAGTLVLGVAEQLDAAALVGGETGDLLDDVADERGALAQVTLGAGDSGLDDAGGGLLYSGEKKISCQPASIVCIVCFVKKVKASSRDSPRDETVRRLFFS